MINIGGVIDTNSSGEDDPTPNFSNESLDPNVEIKKDICKQCSSWTFEHNAFANKFEALKLISEKLWTFLYWLKQSQITVSQIFNLKLRVINYSGQTEINLEES